MSTENFGIYFSDSLFPNVIAAVSEETFASEEFSTYEMFIKRFKTSILPTIPKSSPKQTFSPLFTSHFTTPFNRSTELEMNILLSQGRGNRYFSEILFREIPNLPAKNDIWETFPAFAQAHITQSHEFVLSSKSQISKYIQMFDSLSYSTAKGFSGSHTALRYSRGLVDIGVDYSLEHSLSGWFMMKNRSRVLGAQINENYCKFRVGNHFLVDSTGAYHSHQVVPFEYTSYSCPPVAQVLIMAEGTVNSQFRPVDATFSFYKKENLLREMIDLSEGQTESPGKIWNYLDVGMEFSTNFMDRTTLLRFGGALQLNNSVKLVAKYSSANQIICEVQTRLAAFPSEILRLSMTNSQNEWKFGGCVSINC